MPKSAGKLFEEDFKKSIPKDVFTQRLKDDMSGFKGVANICDYILYRYPYLYLFELKSHKGKSIPFSALREKQYSGLNMVSNFKGVTAGFIFNFRDYNKTYFVDADVLYSYIIAEEKKSFSLKWCEDNGVIIGQKKKRTRYRYRLDEFLDYVGQGGF